MRKRWSETVVLSGTISELFAARLAGLPGEFVSGAGAGKQILSSYGPKFKPVREFGERSVLKTGRQIGVDVGKARCASLYTPSGVAPRLLLDKCRTGRRVSFMREPTGRAVNTNTLTPWPRFTHNRRQPLNGVRNSTAFRRASSPCKTGSGKTGFRQGLDVRFRRTLRKVDGERTAPFNHAERKVLGENKAHATSHW